MANIRCFLLAAVLAGAGLGSAGTAAWSAFPDRPIRFILSHPPGGSADVIARLMQPKLEKLLGQPLIIENRAGAGGIIAMDALAKAKPDGYPTGGGAAGGEAGRLHDGDGRLRFARPQPGARRNRPLRSAEVVPADCRRIGPAVH